VIHFSIQHDHLHAIVGATSTRALSRGMQGLGSRLARQINKRLERRGQVFCERFHARPLATPREVRHAIVHVLTNAAKHAHADRIADQGTACTDGIDPCSSARWFDGWRRPPPRDERPPCTARPHTWLLSKGWRRHGLVQRHEAPAQRPPLPAPAG
jgi:hypothetical protein